MKKNLALVPVGKNKTAMVDREYLDEVLNMGPWRIVKDAFTMRPIPTATIKHGKTKYRVGLHRFISRAPAGSIVMFLDENPMNCTRDNLLICTPAQHPKLKKLIYPGDKRK